MNDTEIISIIILLVTLVLMFSKKVSLPVAACIGAVAMSAFGILPTKDMLKQFASSTIATMFGMMVIGGGIFRTGLAGYCGKMLSKIGKSEKMVVLTCVVFGTIMSSFLSRSTCFFMFLPIIISISLASNISLQKILLPFVTGCSLGQQMTLVGCTTNLAINNSIVELGYEGIGFLEMTPFGILQFLITVPTILFLGLKVLPDRQIIPEMAQTGSSDVPDKITFKMALSGIIMLLTMICMAMDIEAYPTELCAIIGALITILTGCLDVKGALQSINWNALFMIAGMTAVAKGIQETDVMGKALGPVFSSMTSIPPFLILISITLVTSIATQFMNDAALAGIVGPLLVPFVDLLNIPAHLLGTAAVFGVSAAMITPTSTSTASPTIEVGKYSLAEFAKFGSIIMAAKLVSVVIYFAVFTRF